MHIYTCVCVCMYVCFFKLRLFFGVIPEAPDFCHKKIGKLFLLDFNSICMSSKRGSKIFKIFFQTGHVNILVLRGVF